MPRLSAGAAESVPAFPGAVGQGAVAVGGRGGDVYHVVNLKDYDPKKDEPVVAGSLRYAISSAHGPRTIVFDVGGGIKLHGTLTVDRSKLTIAGQTAPGGITLWGYPLQVDGASDVIIRFIRVRTGDFNARAPKGNDSLHGKGAMDLEAPDANGIGVIHSSRIILDHVSTAWGMDETLSVTHCARRDRAAFDHRARIGSVVPSQRSARLRIADSRRNYARRSRQGVGGYTLYGNLWALNRARNPSVGGQQTLKPGQSESRRRRADVNIVNNVIYGWSDRPTHRNDFGRIRLNFVGNYFVNGPANKSPFIFFDHNPAPTIIYQDGNMLDANLNRELDGKIVGLPSDIERNISRDRCERSTVWAAAGETAELFQDGCDTRRAGRARPIRVSSRPSAIVWRATKLIGESSTIVCESHRLSDRFAGSVPRCAWRFAGHR